MKNADGNPIHDFHCGTQCLSAEIVGAVISTVIFAGMLIPLLILVVFPAMEQTEAEKSHQRFEKNELRRSLAHHRSSLALHHVEVALTNY